MPKVGKLKFRINNEYREFEMWYKQSDGGFFLKGFPEEVTKLGGGIGIQKTEIELNNVAKLCIEKYHELISTTTKYLKIKIDSTAETIMNLVPNSHGSYSGMKKGIPNWFTTELRSSGKGFSVDWERIIKITGARNKYYTVTEDWSPRYEMSDTEYGIDNKFILLDYTPEREKFLMDLDEKIEDLIFKIGGFFGDREKLLSYMDSGVKLLE